MFQLAWVDDTETEFNPAVHLREDEDVFALSIEHLEGNFARLTLDLRNPRRQMLLPENDIWLWLAKDNAPIYFGRLVAVPEDLAAELTRLTFLARPKEYEATKRALANQLKVLPYWDEVWIRDELLDDPDVVLEARPELYCIDRVTHAVTTSNILFGEDGTIEFGPDDFFYDSLRINYSSPPVTTIKVKAEISFEQHAQGTLNISRELIGAFAAAGSQRGMVSSYTGQGLEADWPETGADLKGGWFIANTVLSRADGVWLPSTFRDVSVASLKPVNDEEGSKSEAFFAEEFAVHKARFYLWEFQPTFELGYNVKRQYIERVSFDVHADVQPVFSDGGTIEEFNISSRKVHEPLIEGGTPFLVDLRRNSYIRTDRGRRSLEYLIAVVRAKLLMRARVVNISITIPFDDGLQLSLRKNAIITDGRILTGQAAGKIIRYVLRATGDGKQECILTIGCAVGFGNTVQATAGDSEYADDDYDVDWQYRTAENYEPIAGEITYEDYSNFVINDDGIVFSQLKPSDVILAFDVINGVNTQDMVLSTNYPDIPAAIEALNAVYTEVWLELRPLTIEKPVETEFPITISRLMVPQMVVV